MQTESRNDARHSFSDFLNLQALVIIYMRPYVLKCWKMDLELDFPLKNILISY